MVRRLARVVSPTCRLTFLQVSPFAKAAWILIAAIIPIIANPQSRLQHFDSLHVHRLSVTGDACTLTNVQETIAMQSVPCFKTSYLPLAEKLTTLRRHHASSLNANSSTYASLITPTASKCFSRPCTRHAHDREPAQRREFGEADGASDLTGRRNGERPPVVVTDTTPLRHRPVASVR